MTDVTPKKQLPLMESSQAQPEVIYNEAMRILDDDAGGLEVEQDGASPGATGVAKIKFIGATVVEETGGVAVVTIDGASGSGSLTVDTLTAIDKITFSGPAVSVAPGATGEAIVTIDTVSGGGGGGSGNILPDAHPVSPDALDDEFEATSLDGKWIWVNQGGASAILHNGSILLAGDTTGGANNNVLQQAITGASWTIQAGRLFMRSGSVAGSNSSIGIIVRNSANSHITLFGMFTAPAITQLVQQLNSPTSVSSNTLSAGSLPAGILGDTGESAPVYYRIVYDGTNLKYQVSGTGIEGTYYQLYAESVASWLGAITHVGFGVNSANAGTAVQLICDSFRKLA